MSKVNNNIFQTAQNTIDIQRSTFKRPFQHKTSANLGEIIPFYLEEVLPGDTITLKTAKLIQTGTLIAPIMDNLYFDTYYFFCPSRILWDHFKQFMGENDTDAWTQSSQYTIPKTMINISKTQATAMKSGKCLFNYLTKATPPTSIEDITGKVLNINELPLRAYYMICNEYFRNENTKAPTLFTKGDAQNTNISYFDSPYIANKFKDYFTSALPAPQKGPSVSLPLGSYAPIIGGNQMTPLNNPLKFKSSVTQAEGNEIQIAQGTTGNVTFKTTSLNDTAVTYTNLLADLKSATAATINSLRLAFQLQKMYERDARGGTRFDEHIKATYGVNINSGVIDIPEYLFGDRMPITIDKVIASTQANDTDGKLAQSLGNKGGYSNSAKVDNGFTKSFVEPGYILGVGVLRQENTYSEAMQKLWFKSERIDFYEPVFANIGEQPIYLREAQLNTYLMEGFKSKTVFGYQEAWSEYRYSPSGTSGIINPNATGALSYWTLAETYTTPDDVLDSAFTDCDKSMLDRALAASSQATGAQYIADIYVDSKWTRCMPIASIPGLIDHH